MDWLQKLSSGVFIIAEAGINHNGDMELARTMIDVAAESGANAIKFQTFRVQDLLTKDAPKADYQKRITGEEESQFDMLKRCQLSRMQHEKLIMHCKDLGIVFISTPFEEKSADLLDELEVPLFKIPSGEITNLPFLNHVAQKKRPMIISTGMSTIGEVDRALQTVRYGGCECIALLHCTSNYPTEVHDVNLKAMQTMNQAFQVPVGYSDHTLGCEIAAASVALGARIVEKHFTMDKTLPGPDHQASLEPDEMVEFIRVIRNVEIALGNGHKEPVESELSTRTMARKSLVFGRSAVANSIVTNEMLEAKRPATGLSPVLLEHVVGRRLICDVEEGTFVSWDMLN